MVELADIKRDLPKWPDYIIEEWLLYLANREDTGWPPPDPIGDHAWAHIIVKPIAWWRNVDWKLENIDCSFEHLSANTKTIVAKMFAAQIGGKRIPSYDDENTKKRFKEALHFLLHNGSFPKPLIAMQIDTGLSILDGNHRIAAHFASQKMHAEQLQAKGMQRPPKEQQVWIGTHSAGEVLEE